jgi:hypothetical protein
MRKVYLALITFAIAIAGTTGAYAHDSFSLGLNIGIPGYYAAPPVRYYSAPPVTYYDAPPVVYYNSPPPVYFRAPAPQVYFGYYDEPRHFDRGGWGHRGWGHEGREHGGWGHRDWR